MTRRTSEDRTWAEPCAQCGLARINVVHTLDIDNAPEGREYYEQNVPNRHAFVGAALAAGGQANDEDLRQGTE